MVKIIAIFKTRTHEPLPPFQNQMDNPDAMHNTCT